MEYDNGMHQIDILPPSQSIDLQHYSQVALPDKNKNHHHSTSCLKNLLQFLAYKELLNSAYFKESYLVYYC